METKTKMVLRTMSVIRDQEWHGRCNKWVNRYSSGINIKPVSSYVITLQ